MYFRRFVGFVYKSIDFSVKMLYNLYKIIDVMMKGVLFDGKNVGLRIESLNSK